MRIRSEETIQRIVKAYLACPPDMRFGQFLENCSNISVYNIEDAALADCAEVLKGRFERTVK